MTEEERLVAKRAKEREASRRYRERYPERAAAANKKWATNNPDKKREASKRWQLNNPERLAQIRADWIKKRAARRKSDTEYAMQLREYGKAYKLRKKKSLRTKRTPAWLQGTVPQLTGTIRLHLVATPNTARTGE